MVRSSSNAAHNLSLVVVVDRRLESRHLLHIRRDLTLDKRMPPSLFFGVTDNDFEAEHHYPLLVLGLHTIGALLRAWKFFELNVSLTVDPPHALS